MRGRRQQAQMSVKLYVVWFLRYRQTA